MHGTIIHFVCSLVITRYVLHGLTVEQRNGFQENRSPPPSPSRSLTNPRNFLELERIFCTMTSGNYVGMNDGMAQTFLPLSNIEEFLSLVASYEKLRIKKEAEETAKKVAKLVPNKCKKYHKNQARCKGGLCNTCSKSK